MTCDNDPDGLRLPIKLDTTPATASTRRSRSSRCTTGRARWRMEAATANARRLGLGRRAFLVSACGAATDAARQ